MSRKTVPTISSAASAAILEWPNLLARELYSAALRRAEDEQREVVLDDVNAAWPIAVGATRLRINRQVQQEKRRGKPADKAA